MQPDLHLCQTLQRCSVVCVTGHSSVNFFSAACSANACMVCGAARGHTPKRNRCFIIDTSRYPVAWRTIHVRIASRTTIWAGLLVESCNECHHYHNGSSSTAWHVLMHASHATCHGKLKWQTQIGKFPTIATLDVNQFIPSKLYQSR